VRVSAVGWFWTVAFVWLGCGAVVCFWMYRHEIAQRKSQEQAMEQEVVVVPDLELEQEFLAGGMSAEKFFRRLDRNMAAK
jgi:hypothetical protein